MPIRNGVAVYKGEPLPHGAHWAITVHDVGGLPIFRSGPLAQLPGPASEITLVSQVSVFRVSSGTFFGIDSPDGAPELVRQRLNSLPEPLRVDSVKFSADAAVTQIAEEQLALFGASIPATLVSATQIAAILAGSDPQIRVVVHGGAIIGGGTGINRLISFHL